MTRVVKLQTFIECYFVMYAIRWFLLKSCIFGVFISVTEASVLLKTFDGETTYLKGSNVTLVCTITPYNNDMTWYVDNQLYADCFLGNCGPSLNTPHTFIFTFDETAGVFKLTIDSVDSSHEGLSFACDDGNVRETISFNVTTVPNKGNGDNDDSTRSTVAEVGYGFAGVCGFGLVCIVIYLLVKNRCCRQKKESMLTKYREKHRRITDNGKISCEKCSTSESSAYCSSCELYLCLECLKRHQDIQCVLLSETRDKDIKDYECCCNEINKTEDACQFCNQLICSKCNKNHEHGDCTSHQQLHGPLNTWAQMCCGQNTITEESTNTVNFCIQCKTFICLFCLKGHGKHLIISSLTNLIHGYAQVCCDNISVDFCISCKKFICASCLERHDKDMVISALIGLISTRAVMCCDSKKKKIMDFCILCQTFICGNCRKEHNNHITFSSLMAKQTNVFCKGCAQGGRFPIECLALHESVFLCSMFYETGHLEKALINRNQSQYSIIQQLQENQKSCQVHEGNERISPEVYCLICKLYMCFRCFKKHRGIKDNLFYCNRCHTDPIECWDLTSMEFNCGKCFDLLPYIPVSYPKKVMSKMNGLDNTCKLHEGEQGSTTDVVYCLVCKTTMCKSCFRDHKGTQV